VNADQPMNVAELLARTYLDALQAKDKDAILSILAEDFVLEVPCNVSGTNDFSDSWHGIDTSSQRYDDTFRQIEVLRQGPHW
jgi:ketosteroid isomerase-like protein